MKRTLIIQGHPSRDSLCYALADSYEAGARSTSGEVRRVNLCDLKFDPILHFGNRGEQVLEPDLLKVQQDIAWAEHLVFVYPNWWGSMPALLKGFFDRTFLPGFAYKYRTNSSLWDKLLTGRTAQLLVTMDTPGWYYRWIWNRPGHNQMKHTILGFCGIRTIGIHEFAPIHGATPMKREAWLTTAKALGIGKR
jgi:putative NADPH-quinone reductase